MLGIHCEGELLIWLKARAVVAVGEALASCI